MSQRDGFLNKFPQMIMGPKATLRQAMEVITSTQVGIVLVTDASKRLLGIVVDSDIRRALLRGDGMEVPVTRAMNPKPFVADSRLPQPELAALFREHRKAYIPLVDSKGRLVSLAGMGEHIAPVPAHENWVVVMAGGQGRRLRPLTEDTPKPMMKVGDKPLLEVLLERLVASGLKRFIFTVNYLAHRIQDHFGDGSRWGARIEYIVEKKELGTAGALSLIAKKFEGSLIVMNADLLTKVNFRALLNYHQESSHMATLCVREYDFQVPYGVVQIRDQKLHGIVEKPVHKFFVNAGIYVLEPRALVRLKKGVSRDMPDLLEELRRSKPGSVGCFPVQEYWLDIGKPEDYRQAIKDYESEF